MDDVHLENTFMGNEKKMKETLLEENLINEYGESVMAYGKALNEGNDAMENFQAQLFDSFVKEKPALLSHVRAIAKFASTKNGLLEKDVEPSKIDISKAQQMLSRVYYIVRTMLYTNFVIF